ncbi:hypothetical protein H6P81_010544 [Aristolochia fimbriata]|uniref:Clathrin heavy chain n=1 Tax=Aristolochia fimbriata TaxID=158543 RepID=A0AAV7EQ94_ARIFI|nr:hypothetical protein H6P81_010544 [Aristolochia fimbriata]
MLELVTQTAVCHGSIEGESEPIKLFERTAKAVHIYLLPHPGLINDPLSVLALRVDQTCVADRMRKACHLRLVKPYMVAVRSNNVSAVNEAFNEIYVEEEDYDRLCDSIDLHDNIERIGLALKVEKHDLLEMRRIAAYIYKKAGSWKQSIALSRKDNLYEVAMETCFQSGDSDSCRSCLFISLIRERRNALVDASLFVMN